MPKRVLLIDDDADVVRATRRLIAPTYHVETALGVESAIALITSGQRFDAILCDYDLGDSNASDFMAALSAFDTAQAQRIVVYSGVSVMERERLSGQGIRVLPKPSRRNELIDAIERVSAPPPQEGR